MKEPKHTPILILILSCLAGFFLFGPGWDVIFKLNDRNAPPESLSAETQQLQDLSSLFAKVAERVSPNVVQIDITRRTPIKDPHMEFLRRWFGERFRKRINPQIQEQKSLGTGVIVDPEKGYILTNSHVVLNAVEIKIRLFDDTEYMAQLVGTSKNTDLAVLKINANNLPAVALGNSDLVRPGHLVLAIGNPFGLGHTVTQGIVSARGRWNLGLSRDENYIQTDAAINPGNSGGPLVNMQGEVIGINTAIISKSGGYQGVGFAIPMNMARRVMDSIIYNRPEKRKRLGIVVQDVSPELAARFNFPHTRGAIVTGIEKESPAEKAGLETGDIIVKIGSRSITSVYSMEVAAKKFLPGAVFTIEYYRNGNKRTAAIEIE